MGYGEAKKALHEKFEAHFAPLREKREALCQDLDTVHDVLASGATRAQETAQETLGKVRVAMGLD